MLMIYLGKQNGSATAGTPAPPAKTAAAAPPPPPASTAPGDYSHYNNKLSINDFDLLKVLFIGFYYTYLIY